MSFAPGWRGTDVLACEFEQKMGFNKKHNPWTGVLNKNIMSVRAKFHIASIQAFHSTDGTVTSKTVKMSPVYGDTPENKEWSKWTPSGEITMNITNPDAYDQFVPGKDVLVTFENAE